MTTATEMQAKVDKTVTNMDRIQQFVNGGPTETVTLDGGVVVPTIRSIVGGTTATTAQLTSVTSSINTVGKYRGKSVYNTTTDRPVWAKGDEASSVWVDSTGATRHTPV